LVLATVIAALAVLLVGRQVLVRFSGQPSEHQAFKIDPNTAPQEVIQTLPKIGPSRARDWVKARQKRPFRSVRDIQARVTGIGPATAQAIAPFLEFEDAPPTTRPRSRSTKKSAQTALATSQPVP